MGWLIDTLKIPAFIITLAGMFFLRGGQFSHLRAVPAHRSPQLHLPVEPVVEGAGADA